MVTSGVRGSALGGAALAAVSSGEGANVVWSISLQPVSSNAAARIHFACMPLSCSKAAGGQDAPPNARTPSMTAQTNQRIDGKRLWDSLMSMAEIGATPKGGVRRLTLTEVDRRGRDRFRAECEAAGLAVRVDAIGNMFARRAGR